MIYAFGDSHTWAPAMLEGILSVHVSAITLHRLGRPGQAVELIQTQPLNSGDRIILMAGEVDIRCHVGKHLKERSSEDILMDLAIRAKAAMTSIRKHTAAQEIFMCDVIPPARKYMELRPGDYPVVGSLWERADWTRTLNFYLENLLGDRFIRVYNPYQDEDGALIPKYTDETGFHLSEDYAPECFGELLERVA